MFLFYFLNTKFIEIQYAGFIMRLVQHFYVEKEMTIETLMLTY